MLSPPSKKVGNLKIFPLKREEIPFVLEIRNHLSTKIHLDDNREFTLEQGFAWFDTYKPDWYSIYLENVFIGYIRTLAGSIGCDIHPDYRGFGYGRHALNWIICQKLAKNENKIWLQCFADNTVALDLYHSLGFVIIADLLTRDKLAYKMELNIKKHKMDFLTIANKSHAYDYLEFLKHTMGSSNYIEINWKILNETDIDLTQRTNSHVWGIEYLLKSVETSYFMICDYDTAILCKNWDKIICFLMNQYVAIGTEYPASYKKYVDFPTLFFSAWNTQTWQEVKPNLARDAFYNPSLSFYRYLENPDIGNALPTAFQGKKFYSWSCGSYNELETYYVYDLPFVTHLGRGSSRELKTHPRAIEWQEKVLSVQNCNQSSKFLR